MTDIQPQPTNSAPDQGQVSIPQAMWRGFLHGGDLFTQALTDPVLKGAAKLEGLPDDAVANMHSERDADYAQASAQHNIATGIGNLAGQTLGAIPIAAAASAAIPSAAAGGVAGLALRSAAQGAALGGVEDPGSNGSRLTNAAIGAGTMGALGGALGLAGKGIVGAIGASKTATGLLDTAEQTGIPASLSDVASPGTGSILNSITKYIPFSGFGALKTQQQAAIEPGIKQFMSNVAQTTNGSEQAVADAISNRADSLKSQAGDLFDQVSQQAKDSGAPDVTLGKTSDVVSSLSEDTLNNPAIKRVLNQLPNNGNTLSFDDVRDLRSMTGNQFSQLQRQVATGTASTDDLQALASIKQGIDGDLDKWGMGSNNPDIVHDYTQARNFYSSYAQTFKTPQMVEALNDGVAMETMVNRLLTDNNSHRVGNVMDALGSDNAGQARAFALQTALTKASTTTAQGTSVDLNSFLGQLNKQSPDAQQAVWGDQMDKLQGLNNLLGQLAPKLSAPTPSAIGNAAQTAGQVGGAAALAGAAAHVSPTMVGLVPLARMFNSPKMASLLTRWNYITPDSPDSIISSLKQQGAQAIRGVLATNAAIGYKNLKNSQSQASS